MPTTYAYTYTVAVA